MTRRMEASLGRWFLGAALAVLPVEAASGPVISVDEAWARSLPPVTTSSELYMVMHNRGDQADRLVGARSPACGMAELFEWHTSPAGAMMMRPVAGVEVPPGGRLQLKPAGLHVMCMERKGSYPPGATLPLTLRFQQSGDVSIRVTIREP